MFEKGLTTKNKEIFVDELFAEQDYPIKTKLYEYLSQNKNILKDNIPDKTSLYKQRNLLYFKCDLEDWGRIYYTFAGFEYVTVEEDYQDCYVESGDDVIEDVRGATGKYCMCHESLELTPLDKNKKGNGIRPSSVNLAYRFLWIQGIFSTWENSDESPLEYWQSVEQINQAYENEKSYYQNDPHLALYWILHFGLLQDSCYEEIKMLLLLFLKTLSLIY